MLRIWAFLWHPLVGDKIYGGDESCYLDFIATGWTPDLQRRLILPRHALHACKLTFPWREQSITVESPLPEDMAELLEKMTAADVIVLAMTENRWSFLLAVILFPC